MKARLDVRSVLRLRAGAQRLTENQDDDGRSLVEVASDTGGVQAQETAAALLALRARCRGLTEAAATAALEPGGGLLRTWLMRGTLHLVPAADLPWLLPIFGPRFIERGRRRLRDLGISEETVTRAVDVIAQSLRAEGPLTRQEITARLDAAGIPAEGQRTIHLLRRAALAGQLTYGAPRDGQETFSLLPPELTRMMGQVSSPDSREPARGRQALSSLVRRYLDAFGPASLSDFASWSGLTAAQSRDGWEQIADDLIEVTWPSGRGYLSASRSSWLNEAPPARASLRLLPRFDAFLLGYTDRDLSVPKDYARRVHPGGGIIRPTVVVDGRVIGTWRASRRRNLLRIEVSPFERLDPDLATLLDEEATGLGHFYGTEAELVLSNDTAPPH